MAIKDYISRIKDNSKALILAGALAFSTLGPSSVSADNNYIRNIERSSLSETVVVDNSYSSPSVINYDKIEKTNLRALPEDVQRKVDENLRRANSEKLRKGLSVIGNQISGYFDAGKDLAYQLTERASEAIKGVPYSFLRTSQEEPSSVYIQGENGKQEIRFNSSEKESNFGSFVTYATRPIDFVKEKILAQKNESEVLNLNKEEINPGKSKLETITEIKKEYDYASEFFRRDLNSRKDQRIFRTDLSNTSYSINSADESYYGPIRINQENTTDLRSSSSVKLELILRDAFSNADVSPIETENSFVNYNLNPLEISSDSSNSNENCPVVSSNAFDFNQGFADINSQNDSSPLEAKNSNGKTYLDLNVANPIKKRDTGFRRNRSNLESVLTRNNPRFKRFSLFQSLWNWFSRNFL